MTRKTVISLAFAAAAVALTAMPTAHARDLATNGPQANPGDFRGGWSAEQNVRESQLYDRLLQTNLRFRQARMRKECGPITDPQLRADCISSFDQSEPYVGSSPPRRHYRHYRGAGE